MYTHFTFTVLGTGFTEGNIHRLIYLEFNVAILPSKYPQGLFEVAFSACSHVCMYACACQVSQGHGKGAANCSFLTVTPGTRVNYYKLEHQLTIIFIAN